MLLHKIHIKYQSQNYFPKGLTVKIKEGNKVKTDIMASNIARPVNSPK